MTAAAAKSLQSCPTLCDPIDGSSAGSLIPGILQARTLEWVAISFSNAWKWKVKVKLLRCVRLLATPWTAAYQAPPSMGFFQARVLEWGAIPFSNWMINLSLIEKLYMTIISLLRQSYKVISHRMSMTEIRHTWALILVYRRHWWEMLHEWRKANKNGGVSRLY